MIKFSAENIKEMHHLYKINLINSCSGYKSANLIGTISNESIENVAIFSSVTHLGSNPPLLGFFLRPTTVPRNTYENIKQTGYYTINHVYKNIVEDAHHTSAKYPEYISEFEVTNLKHEYRDAFTAPFVRNSPIQLAMEYVEEHKIQANNTVLVVGEIQSIYIDNVLLQKDGYVDLSNGKIAAINGLDGYVFPKTQKRLSYQRPTEIQTKKV